MKTTTYQLISILVASILALPAMALQNATPTVFVPTPMNAQAPTRFYMGLDNANVFSGGETAYPGTFIPKGQVGLMNLQLELALIHSISEGFDVGLGIHGGVQSPYSMFFGSGPNFSLFPADASRYGMIIGADLMVRYMQFFTDMFYGGVQVQGGYNYTDTAPGVADGAINSFTGKSWYSPYTSRTAANSFIPINAGLVLGWQFNKSVDFYLFPAVELGQTGNQTNTSVAFPAPSDLPSNPDTGIWKSAVGMNVATGVAFNMGYCKVVIQLKPRIANFNNANSWGLDMYTGGSFDF